MLHRAADETEGCRVIYLSPLKALAVDVERNLRSPLAGIANMARQAGVPFHQPEISIRTGDTSQKERSRFRRHPAEILITTPESLYLLLTSDAAASLRRVDTVIIDEIHAVVPTKRGAHLALSLERLEAITEGRVQRIGLSATQRPLEEVAHFLGGSSTPAETAENDATPEAAEDSPLVAYRPVTIVDASEPKQLDLRIEVPVEDMARMGQKEELPSGAASQGPKRTSIWTAIHPRLVEIIRQRHSTIIFVNSRRIAERLAGAINELAGEQLARAHHGSLAAAQRSEIEEQLKAGRLRALVATSSLELGIDMGAVDLVIQIEAPPSVASAMQRIGRAGHHVGAASEGVIFPKYRADLVACAAVTRAMHEDLVESTRFLRNPLDVLAQQIVAIVAQPPALAASPLAEREIPVGRSLPPDSRRRSLQQPHPHRLHRRARSAGRPLSLRRIRRSAAAHHLGPHARHPDAARGSQDAGHPEWRHHSRSRPLRRISLRSGRQAGPRGRAGRRDGVRKPDRRHLCPGRLDLAHR